MSSRKEAIDDSGLEIEIRLADVYIRARSGEPFGSIEDINVLIDKICDHIYRKLSLGTRCHCKPPIPEGALHVSQGRKEVQDDKNQNKFTEAHRNMRSTATITPSNDDRFTHMTTLRDIVLGILSGYITAFKNRLLEKDTTAKSVEVLQADEEQHAKCEVQPRTCISKSTTSSQSSVSSGFLTDWEIVGRRLSQSEDFGVSAVTSMTNITSLSPAASPRTSALESMAYQRQHPYFQTETRKGGSSDDGYYVADNQAVSDTPMVFPPESNKVCKAISDEMQSNKCILKPKSLRSSSSSDVMADWEVIEPCLASNDDLSVPQKLKPDVNSSSSATSAWTSDLESRVDPIQKPYFPMTKSEHGPIYDNGIGDDKAILGTKMLSPPELVRPFKKTNNPKLIKRSYGSLSTLSSGSSSSRGPLMTETRDYKKEHFYNSSQRLYSDDRPTTHTVPSSYTTSLTEVPRRHTVMTKSATLFTEAKERDNGGSDSSAIPDYNVVSESEIGATHVGGVPAYLFAQSDQVERKDDSAKLSKDKRKNGKKARRKRSSIRSFKKRSSIRSFKKRGNRILSMLALLRKPVNI